jgi:hypothetical protein
MPIRKTPTNSNYQRAALTLLTSRTIISAASNTTGLKLLSGSCFEQQTGSGFGHFVISTSSPSAMSDGLSVSQMITFVAGANNYCTYKIIDDLFIPSGYGLYWVSDSTSSVTSTDVSWSAA